MPEVRCRGFVECYRGNRKALKVGRLVGERRAFQRELNGAEKVLKR